MLYVIALDNVIMVKIENAVWIILSRYTNTLFYLCFNLLFCAFELEHTSAIEPNHSYSAL